MKEYKVLFADLDGTLIDTVKGGEFPEGIWDMKIKFEVLDAIKKSGVKCLVIITNQGGIEKGFVDERHFLCKLRYLQRSFEEYLGISVQYEYCTSNDKANPYRKPNTAMLGHAVGTIIEGMYDLDVDKSEMLFIGDASGKKGQFSDSDKKTAENFGIDYYDVDDFVQEINK